MPKWLFSFHIVAYSKTSNADVYNFGLVYPSFKYDSIALITTSFMILSVLDFLYYHGVEYHIVRIVIVCPYGVFLLISVILPGWSTGFMATQLLIFLIVSIFLTLCTTIKPNYDKHRVFVALLLLFHTLALCVILFITDYVYNSYTIGLCFLSIVFSFEQDETENEIDNDITDCCRLDIAIHNLDIKTVAAYKVDCSICFENNDSNFVVFTKCNHYFHYACLKEWFKVHTNCPLCRLHVNTNFVQMHQYHLML